MEDDVGVSKSLDSHVAHDVSQDTKTGRTSKAKKLRSAHNCMSQQVNLPMLLITIMY